MSALRFLFLTLLLAVDFVLSAEEQTINKTAEPGQNVTLPCEHGKEKIHMIVLEWTKPGLEEHKRIDVFVYRDGQIESVGQHSPFKNRVDLQDEEMKDGNASLILKNVTTDDRGTYQCKVKTVNDSVPQLISTIHLEVSPPPGTQEGGDKGRSGQEGGGQEGGGKEGASSSSLGLTVGLPVSLLCVIVGVAAWICYRKPACLQRFRLFSRQPPTETPKPPEPTEPEPDETEMSLLSSPSEPPAAGPSSTSGTQTAASSPEHPAHPE